MDVSEPDRADWIGDVVEAHRAGRPLALLFDYDGTLTPIVHHPTLARLSDRTRRMLADLRDSNGVSVGVISGRSLRDVRDQVGLRGLFYAGSGGLELDLYGERITYPEASAFRSALDGLAGQMARLLSAYAGAWIEHKPVSCSLHFRALAPLRALAFQREVFSVLSPWTSIRHRVVSQAIELSPAAGWDKGTAVAALLARLDDGSLPVYAGDAANDAEAMAVTSCLGGVAIGIGAEAPSLATHRVDSPGELAAGLERLLSSLTRPRTRSPVAAGRADFADGKPDLPSGGAVNELRGETASAAPGILVVDADPLARSRTADGLRAEGWQVWEAGAVEEAVGTLRRMHGRVKAAIVDLQMPGIQGWRALRELGATSPSLVCCATSSGVSTQAADAFRRTSETPLFVRPFRVEMVSAELLRLLGAGETDGC